MSMFHNIRKVYLVRGIKPPNLVLFYFFSVGRVGPVKKKYFLLFLYRFFHSFGPIKSLSSFSTAQTWNNSLKKSGKQDLWFDFTNKIINSSAKIHFLAL